ncbi:carboxyl transferase domain-containing protein [Pimelobacter simplex]|uniref:carboxyl transferase domain-containing protein n=1 Tax=Nocardioides simplex TaxID=2045 RepID=UPI00366D9113
MTDDAPAPAQGLTEVLARRFLTTDAARAEKVARWHARGRRTARENLADLVDPGSFVEYGRFVTAAQEGRRPLADLVVEAPADGIIGGTATIDGRRARCCRTTTSSWPARRGCGGTASPTGSSS